MANLPSAAASGHYARKQLLSRDALVAWSHTRRFETAVALAREFAGKRILDYGCGDGTFLGLLCSGPHSPASAVGAEIDDVQVNDCRTRFASLSSVQFQSIARLDESDHAGAYDAVVCMEVLEHVVALEPVIEQLWRVLDDRGTLLVSVPVETGLPLILKQAARRIAGWRGIGDYRSTSSYTVREYVASLFAGPAPHIPRPRTLVSIMLSD